MDMGYKCNPYINRTDAEETTMPISEWPADERPREKLARNGVQALSDAELLAIFLRTGVKGRSAVDIGRALLHHFGGLRRVLNAEPRELAEAPGVGPAKCAQLQASLELGRRYLAEKLERGGPLTNPKRAAKFFTHQLRDRQREAFAVIYLDNRHHVLRYEELFQGTLYGAHVHPREVVKAALKHNAAALICAHNHPSGVAEPSHADTTITLHIRDALELIDVQLLDHLVIGDGEFVSMSERGLF